MTAPQPEFDHNAPQYRFCCGLMHVKFGATMIGIIAVVAAFTCAIFLRAGGPYFPIAFVLFMAIMLLIGVVWEHKGCVLAFIVMHSINIFLLSLVFVGFAIWIIVDSYEATNQMQKMFNIPKSENVMTIWWGLEAGIFCTIVLKISFIRVLIGCYRYFADKQRYMLSRAAIRFTIPTHMYQQPPAYNQTFQTYSIPMDVPPVYVAPPEYAEVVKVKQEDETTTTATPTIPTSTTSTPQQ